MSISLEFKQDVFRLNKLNLPTRYYYFNEVENYIKLLSIGEGIFPKDKIRTKIKLQDSSCIVTTESATKIYPSKKEFGINAINIQLNNSNFEFINDELILFKDSKLMQFLKIQAQENSTFFYTDILSQGRSYENSDFDTMLSRNRFYIDGKLEYLEKFEVFGEQIKDYLKRHAKQKEIFAKLYIKSPNNEQLLGVLYDNIFDSFTYTKNKKMIIGVLSDTNMNTLKEKMNRVWKIYREQLNKKEFNLGKQ